MDTEFTKYLKELITADEGKLKGHKLLLKLVEDKDLPKEDHDLLFLTVNPAMYYDSKNRNTGNQKFGLYGFVDILLNIP